MALTHDERQRILVCTISREGTPEMNEMVRRTLVGLATDGYRVDATHLEHRDGSLSDCIRGAAEHNVIEPTPVGWNPIANAREISARLMAGVRRAAARVCEGRAQVLVYLEGDKFDFPRHIPALAAPVLAGRAELNVATRSAEGYARFPWAQRVVESTFSAYVGRRTLVKVDCLYGPRAYSPAAAALIADYPSDDWGVLVYPMIALFQRGDGYETLEVPGAPPLGYMLKYDPLMRPAPAHLLWRAIQCLGNVRAVNAALRRSASASAANREIGT